MSTATTTDPIPNGLSAEAWTAIGATRNGTGWHVTERDAKGNSIGTSIRPDRGEKRMVPGSKRGLTMVWPPPSGDVGTSPSDPILVVEGATDAAAGYSRNFWTIGRPSCVGGLDLLRELLVGRHIVIVGENDHGPGIDGANKIAAGLLDVCASVRLIFPPRGVKDLREWTSGPHGATRAEILAAIKAVKPYRAESEEPTPPKRRTFIMRRGDQIDDEGTRYLWRRRVPYGAITVPFSRPGRGKSTFGASLTGHVTTGRAFPDGAPCPLGDVVYIKGEGTDAAIRDRMQQAGADPRRYVLIGKADDDESPMIDLAEDSGPLLDVLDQLPETKLLIVDTLDSLYPSMRMIDNANIRRCLWPLQEIAERRNLAVVIFAHTNKGGYADPLDRLSGGRAIGGAARAIWYMGKLDPDDDVHYFAPVKCNDFAPAKPLAYEIVSTSPDTPGVIRWGDEADVSAWDLDTNKPAERHAKAEDCETWLAALLAGGPVPTAEINQQASSAEYGRRVLKKAKDALNITTQAAKGTFPPVYYLCLPGQSAPDHTEAGHPAGTIPI